MHISVYLITNDLSLFFHLFHNYACKFKIEIQLKIKISNLSNQEEFFFVLVVIFLFILKTNLTYLVYLVCD